MSDKNKIISSIYKDNYGSRKDTLEEARKKDPSITYEDVKNWFDKNFVRKTNLRGFNSFIASEPYEEFQMDLFFINDLENQDYKIGILIIDIFSKYMTVIPLKTKQPDDILQAIKDGIDNMGGKPLVFYTDEEGSFNSKIIKQYFIDNHIQHIITRGHAAVAERSIRTIKDLIYRRIDQNPDSQWTDAKILANALTNYNYRMKHRMTKMTPEQC
jgi:hypothetical protein